MKKIIFTLFCLSCIFSSALAQANLFGDNWDFSKSAHFSAPAGWTPASSITADNGVDKRSRVHNWKGGDSSKGDYKAFAVLNPENLSGFLFRYDHVTPVDKTYTYGTEAGNKLTLESNTTYTLKFRYAKWHAQDKEAGRSFKAVIKNSAGNIFSKSAVVTGTGSVALTQAEADCYDFNETFTTGDLGGNNDCTFNLVWENGDVAFVITKMELYKSEDTSVGKYSEDNLLNSYSVGGKLYVEAVAGTSVEIYNTLGVFQFGFNSKGSVESFDLNKGIYIIKTNSTAKKVLVR